MADRDQVQALWDAAAEAFGRVDHWINNAGVSTSRRPLAELPADQLETVVAANLLGAMHGSAVAVRGMTAQGGGTVWNMAGLGSDGRAVPGLTAYGSTKRGTDYLTTGLAKEVKGGPVKVAHLSPAWSSPTCCSRTTPRGTGEGEEGLQHPRRPGRDRDALAGRSGPGRDQERRDGRLAHHPEDHATVPARLVPQAGPVRRRGMSEYPVALAVEDFVPVALTALGVAMPRRRHPLVPVAAVLIVAGGFAGRLEADRRTGRPGPALAARRAVPAAGDRLHHVRVRAVPGVAPPAASRRVRGSPVAALAAAIVLRDTWPAMVWTIIAVTGAAVLLLRSAMRAGDPRGDALRPLAGRAVPARTDGGAGRAVHLAAMGGAVLQHARAGGVRVRRLAAHHDSGKGRAAA